MTLEGSSHRPRHQAYREIVGRLAKDHGIRVIFHKRGAQLGRAGLEEKIVYIPEMRSFTSFFTGLHEIGHILSRHRANDRRPKYLWEYEAFKWAWDYAEGRGMKVPSRTLEYEKSLLAERIHEAVLDGKRQIDPAVAQLVRSSRLKDPDVVFVKKYVSDGGAVSKQFGRR